MTMIDGQTLNYAEMLIANIEAAEAYYSKMYAQQLIISLGGNPNAQVESMGGYALYIQALLIRKLGRNY